jgi:protein O-mannosyl-transferase
VHSNPSASPTGETPEVKDSRPLPSESRPAGWKDRWRIPGVCIFLAAITFAVFGQTLRYGFVNLDDDVYVFDNPVVQKGLTWEGFRWALTYGQIGHWHPLTWLSHMLDCQWYGLRGGGHHLTNVLLHTVTVILLFLVLRRMTGFLWRSAFVAAVFAIHPLRVESVAWIAERKDVLSALFFMLTLGAYVRYVQRRSKAGGQESRAQAFPALDPLARRSEAKMARLWTLDYGLVLLFFALGLLSKNMLVTLPFILLLLDYWPLNRLSSFSPQFLLPRLVEKIPLLVLAIGSCVATFLVSEKLTVVRLPFVLRLENAVVSYVIYLWQMIYPSGLACVYPNPVNYLPLWQVVGALGLLLAISGAVWAFHKTHPYLIVGWLWYVGMMIPVIGMVQISFYAHADRYTYLPQIGLYVLLTWAAVDLCAGWRHRRVVLGGGATIILAALICCARVQTSYWRNSESLWDHTLACTSDNAIAHNNLGNDLIEQGRVGEAITHCQKALEIKPDCVEAHLNLGNALDKMGNVDEAMVHYQKALEIKSDSAEAHNNLGVTLFRKGKGDEAIVHLQKALEIKPDYVEAHNNLGNVLLQKGSVDEAIVQYQKALEIKPDYVEAHLNLGNALDKKGNVDEAMVHYQKALEIKSNSAEAHNNLGVTLFRKGKGDEAIVHLQKALEIKPDYMEAHLNLGNAFLQKGSVDEAVAHYQKVLQIKPDYLEILNNLAWLLATSPDAHIRDGVQAVKYAGRACELTHYGVTILVGTLAAAYAEAGRFDDALATAQKACALAEKSGEQDLLEKNQRLLELYRAHQPYHEAVEKVVPAAP